MGHALLEQVHQHVVEACDDHLLALLGNPRVKVRVLGWSPIDDPVAEGARQHVGDCVLLEVDRADVRGPVERELHRQKADAATDVHVP